MHAIASTTSLFLAATLLLSTTSVYGIPTGDPSLASTPSQLGGYSAYPTKPETDSAYPTITPANNATNDGVDPDAESKKSYGSDVDHDVQQRGRSVSRRRRDSCSCERTSRSVSRNSSCSSSASSRSSSVSSCSSSASSRASSVSSRGSSRSRSRSVSRVRRFFDMESNAFGRYQFHGQYGGRNTRGRCRRRRLSAADAYHGQHSAYDGYNSHHGYGGYDDFDGYQRHGDYGGYEDIDGYQGYHGQDVDDYHGQRGYGGGYGRGGRGSRQQSDYARHNHSENVHDSSNVINSRYGGRYASHQRHADESYLDETGHNMSATDRYGQRISERNHSLDSGRREANSRDLHIRRPDGSSVDRSHRDGSVDTLSQDSRSRTFDGPNRHARESESNFSRNSSEFSSNHERIVN